MRILSIVALILFAAASVFAQHELSSVKSKDENKEAKYSVEIAYPQIRNAKGTAEKDFNNYIKDIIDSEIKSFNEYLPVESVSPDMNYELYINYSEFINTDNVISVLISVYTYTGGAHGLTILTSVNYDMNRNKPLQLRDLLEGNYLKEISDFCIKYILKDDEFADEEWVKNGAAPDEQNYKTFAITKNGLKIFFQQYQVLPYAAGSPEVLISYSLIKSYFIKRGILEDLN